MHSLVLYYLLQIQIIVAKLITVQISHCSESEIIFPCVTDLNEVYIAHHGNTFAY
jgi:hypothetical protein